MKAILLILIMTIALFVTGCAAEQKVPENSNQILFKNVMFTYKELPIRDWRFRTDQFNMTPQGSLLMQGRSYVDQNFHETNFQVSTDLDLCAYKEIKFNSTLSSLTYRESISPSSQVWIQGVKYSSHSLDNITKEKYSHNLHFFSDGARVQWQDDEGVSYDDMCNNFTVQVRCSGGENGTCFASLEIFDIQLGDPIGQ